MKEEQELGPERTNTTMEKSEQKSGYAAWLLEAPFVSLFVFNEAVNNIETIHHP